MRLHIETPVKMRLVDFDADALSRVRSALTYTNKAIAFEINRLKNNPWYVSQHGEEALQDELKRLKALLRPCLVQNDSNGLWTYTGLIAAVKRAVGELSVTSDVVYPEPKLIPWDHKPIHSDRYYQKSAVENLLNAQHGSVSIATGLGKSQCIRNLTKQLALKTMIVAPSVSIARQLLKDLTYHLGRNRVGLFGDGKKDFKKLVTVGLFQSLTRIVPGTPEWTELSKCEVFIVDESHLVAASTLKSICEGIAANAPYRFFFSGTQMRNDGADMLLNGIIGPIVYEMDVIQGVNEGFLSKPNFTMVEMTSPSSYMSSNPDSMLDKHWLKNPDLYRKAAEIANKSVELLGHQVLILIDEVSQFAPLIPHLKHVTKFAHGGTTKVNKKFVPEAYHDSDPEAFVDEFNANGFPILVGTSCISIGTDLRTPKTLINLQGGTSEVKVRQAIGRGTRRQDDKTEFNYFDFMVKVRSPQGDDFMAITHRHALARLSIYQDVYPGLKVIHG